MKIVGQLVCGPNEKYLEQTLKEFKRLCDDAVVCLCNATQREKKMVEKYDFRSYEDNREWGKYQPKIKEDLLKKIHKLGADWILVLDADETVPTVTREILEQISKGKESCFFYVINLWNDEKHYKKSAGFWNVRFYKSDPSKGTLFLRKPVHCGNAPPYFYNQSAKVSHVPHILLHRGLMEPRDRGRKSERYRKYDPNAVHKGREYYDMLEKDTGCAEYKEEEIISKLKNFCETI